MRLHHVQVTCPRGGEDAARRFYGEGLGLTEVAKPVELADRAALEEAVGRLVRMGYAVDRGEEDTFPGYRRVHARDAHGNRLEFLA